MLEIRGQYYNAKDIRKLSRTRRNYLIITFINGDVEETNEYFGDYEFEQLIKEWKELV